MHSPGSEGNHLAYEEHKHVFLALCQAFMCSISREGGDPWRSPSSRPQITYFQNIFSKDNVEHREMQWGWRGNDGKMYLLKAIEGF